MGAGSNPEIRVDAESVRCSWLFSARVSGVRGRDKGLSQMETIDVQRGTRLLMCSDGVHAVLRNGTFRDTKSVMLDALCRHDVGHVADVVLDSYPGDIEFPDDIVVVALDPGRLVASVPPKGITGAPGVIGESA